MRVEIAAGGHQVIVEAPEPLAVVVAAAMNMWTATDPPNLARGYSPVGFAAETAGGPTPPDLTLPARMTDWMTVD